MLLRSSLLICLLLGWNRRAGRGQASATMSVNVHVGGRTSECGPAEVTGLRLVIISNFRGAFRKIAGFPSLVFPSLFISLLP